MTEQDATDNEARFFRAFKSLNPAEKRMLAEHMETWAGSRADREAVLKMTTAIRKVAALEDQA